MKYPMSWPTQVNGWLIYGVALSAEIYLRGFSEKCHFTGYYVAGNKDVMGLSVRAATKPPTQLRKIVRKKRVIILMIK